MNSDQKQEMIATLQRANSQFQQEIQLETLLRAIESTNEGVVISDPNQEDNPIVYANPAFIELTGYLPEDIIGENCRFLQGEASDPETVAQMKQCITQKKIFRGEVVNYKKDQTPFWKFRNRSYSLPFVM